MIGLDLLGAKRAPLTNCVVGVDWGDPTAIDRLTADFRAKLATTPTTYTIGRKLANQGLDFTRKAEAAVKSNPKSILGPANWEVPAGHLKWHLDALDKEVGNRNPLATPYERSDDLKKWVASAYRAMLAGVGTKELQQANDAEFWRDLVASLADLPENMRAVAKRTIGEATGLPWWVWGVGGIAAVTLAGLAAFKILHAAAPAVGRVAAERYLPPGPGSFTR